MRRAGSGTALIAIVPAVMIPVALGLRSVGAADWVVGCVEGGSIGLMLVALAIAIRLRQGRGRRCARTDGARR